MGPLQVCFGNPFNKEKIEFKGYLPSSHKLVKSSVRVGAWWFPYQSLCLRTKGRFEGAGKQHIASIYLRVLEHPIKGKVCTGTGSREAARGLEENEKAGDFRAQFQGGGAVL